MSGARGTSRPMSRPLSRPMARPVGTPAAAPAANENTHPSPPEVDSQSLLQGQSTLIIHHQGEVYRLQNTRQGKLILTK